LSDIADTNSLIAQLGAAILCDGEPMEIEQIVAALNSYELLLYTVADLRMQLEAKRGMR